MKAERVGCGGRIFLGDDTRSEAILLRPIRFRSAGVLISGGLSGTYTYIVDTMYTQFRLGAKFDIARNLAACLEVSVHLFFFIYIWFIACSITYNRNTTSLLLNSSYYTSWYY
jgi:hypothetical protein